jgi:plasmid stabilization system protein ParE
VTEVRLSAVAVEQLERMILTHSLPSDTKDRVRRSLRIAEQFPYAGRELDGRWRPLRFILGPWRWMLIVYIYDEPQDAVLVLTIQDARSSTAATSGLP